MSSAMSIQKQHPIQPQSKKKGLQQPKKTRHQRLRKPDAIFVKETRIQNSAPAITTFSNYLHALQ